MVILSFCSGYLPGLKYGGPVSSLYNLVELIGNDISTYIVCLNHDLNETRPYPDISNGWNCVGKAKVKYINETERNTTTYSRIVKEIKPDIIYVSSVFSAEFNTPIYFVAKKTNIPILLAPRGELNKNALLKGHFKKNIYLLYYRKFLLSKNIYFQATSNEEYLDIMRMMRITEDRIGLLPNVPALPHRKTEISKNKDYLKMCFVGRIVKNKNLLICLEALKKVTSNIVFDIYGPKENLQYWNECEKIIEVLPLNVKVNFFGVLNQLEMRKKYGEYDCLISPTQFENYGQAIVEAMLHDVPVIISKGTTPWDDIGKNSAGFVLALNDIDGFTDAIDKIGKMDTDVYIDLITHLREYVKIKFDFYELKKMYIDEFKKILR